MTFDLEKFLRDARERDREARWQFALSGICPYCNNDRGTRYTCDTTGEIEWIFCHFCHSESQLEEKSQ